MTEIDDGKRRNENSDRHETEVDEAAETNEENYLGDVFRGMILGSVGLIFYLGYRFVRPYWYAFRIEHWLQVEPDYILKYNRTIHPLGYYEYEIYLTESEEPDLVIENRSRRVPVILRVERDFDIRVLSNLEARRTDEEQMTLNGEPPFFQEVQWALNTAPGVYRLVNDEGEPCGQNNARGVMIEYRIYPDKVSQHHIINSIVEVQNALKMVSQSESAYIEWIRTQQ